MPRTHDVIVPNAVPGIEEVVIKHTKTKRGTVRTMEKVVPILQPPTKQSGHRSMSKKRPQPHSQPDEAEGSGGAIPMAAPDGAHAFTDDQEFELQDVATEDSQPQATVCIGFHLHIMVG
jgi:hypothetical protein